MALITKPVTLSNGTVAQATDVESDFTTIYNDYNGNITNANFSASAGIVDTKLAQITTTGKVSGTALTSLASITSASGIIPSANIPTTYAVPAGGIILWSGSIATIPSGWNLCNGTSGTPDLTDRFVICASSDSSGTAYTNVTGALTISGNGTVIAHTHGVTFGSSPTDQGPYFTGAASAVTAGTTASYGTGSKNIAVYYALAYIMKL